MFVHVQFVQWSLFLVHHGRGRWMHDRISMARPPGATLRIEYVKKKRNEFIMNISTSWSLELPTASLKPSSVEPFGQHTPILTATKLLKTDQYCGPMTHGQKFQQPCNIFQGTMTIRRCSTFWTNWQIETKNEKSRSRPVRTIFKHFHTVPKKNTQICCLCQPDGTTRVPTNAGLDLYEARSH